MLGNMKNIAGSYIHNHRNKKLRYIGVDDLNNVYECQGMITHYYCECLKKDIWKI